MSKKDFDEYFLQVANQYEQFKQTLEQISKEAAEGMTDIDFVENLQAKIIPFKQNYERLAYIKYLLDQPNRKHKIKKYQSSISKKVAKLDKSNSTQAVLQENKEILKDIKG